MRPDLIFAPMGALAFLTFSVLGLVPLRRFKAGAAGQIVSDDFKFGESASVPGHVSIPNRNYMNLLELPVLFYVICVILRVSGGVTSLSVSLAWAYVVLRVIHSLIHLSYNHVFHRLAAFFASNMVLVALWIVAGLHLAAG